MINYKKNILFSLVLLFILLCFTAIITFLVDPLQHYRKASFYKPYALEERYMVWGLLKNYDYDSILVGTSVTENFRKDYVDRELNLNILRVPLAGASAYEESLVIKYALKYNKNISTILYGLDFFSFRGKETRLRHGKNSLPKYLINDTVIDDFKYLLNIDVFFEGLIKIFLSNYFRIRKEQIDLNTFWHWDYKEKFGRKYCIEDYNNRVNKKFKNNNYKKYNFYELKKSFDYYILSLCKKYPNIKFIIFFPPYSILIWKSWEHEGELKDILEFKKYILIQLTKYDNIKIYDFQVAKKITHNLDNYKDTNHYSGEINNWIIYQIKKNHYLVKKNNINKYLNFLRKQIKNYNLNF